MCENADIMASKMPNFSLKASGLSFEYIFMGDLKRMRLILR
jgi:hypothetical protein